MDVILVDEQDNEVGREEKLATHKKGLLHRCFSIQLFNEKGELLLQQRAKKKYHCGGLWTNTCCSHQQPGETTLDAAKRRLQEELGITCDVKEVGTFIYKATFDNGLTEWEYDHVLIGTFTGMPQPNPEEVADWKWVSKEAVEKEVKANPEKFTVWFPLVLKTLNDSVPL